MGHYRIISLTWLLVALLSPSLPADILWEYWTGIEGDVISNLTHHADYPDNPTGTDILETFETPTDWQDDYGSRVRGLLIPPLPQVTTPSGLPVTTKVNYGSVQMRTQKTPS